MPLSVGILIKGQISRGYLEGLRGRYGAEISVSSLSEIQSSGAIGILRHLRLVRPDLLLLAIEDENSRCFLPVMKLVALATRARRVAIVGADYKEEALSKVGAIGALGGLAASTVASAIHSLLAYLEIGRLISTRIRANPPPAINRILYINANLWFGVQAGGSVGHISGVINALLTRGIRVTFASCGTRLLIREEADCVALRAPPSFGVPFELNYYRFSRYVAQLLGGGAKARNYDAIYQRLSLANYSGAVLARKTGLPLVTEYNGSEAWVARNWGKPLWFHSLARHAEDAMLQNSDVVVTVSDVLAEELKSRGIEERRIVSYPNCIDPLIFDPAKFPTAVRTALRGRLDVPNDAIVATFIGTFGQWHGAEILAKAIAELIRASADWLIANKVIFLLVGDGIRMPGVKRTLSEVDFQPFCRLVGLVPQSEAPGYLASSDILLSPHVENADGTSFFGSPTKLFEYMAMGKAIVASRLDQIGHVLAGSLSAANLPDDFNPLSEAVGVLAKPGDVQQLLAGLRFCVEEGAWRERLGANARARALARYTWQHHVNAILARLDSVSALR
jgi:glycosyltransferase involved in cell wall biosynthesis